MPVNVFANLPLPVLNGAGAAVYVGTMGPSRSLIVSGTFLGATVAVEGSLDSIHYFPLAVFQSGPAERTIQVMVNWMRLNVSGRSAVAPFSASFDVGGIVTENQYDTATLPAGNGSGPSITVDTFGSFTTFAVAGPFPGASITIEASDDDVHWSTVAQFNGNGGIISKSLISSFYRATVSGRASYPFTPTYVDVCSAADALPIPNPLVTGRIVLGSYEYVATSDGDNNNYTCQGLLGVNQFFYVDTPDDNAVITGLDANLVDYNELVTFAHVSGSGWDLTFAHENGSSSADNRFHLPGGLPIVLTDGMTISFIYSDDINRFVVWASGASVAP